MPEFTKLSLAKLGFAVAGIATFGVGVRVDDSRIRWVGIAFVAVAWFLRFAGPRPGSEPEALQPPEETR
jgi:hypothetical protein